MYFHITHAIASAFNRCLVAITEHGYVAIFVDIIKYHLAIVEQKYRHVVIPVTLKVDGRTATDVNLDGFGGTYGHRLDFTPHECHHIGLVDVDIPVKSRP